jgi:hypothetical protein
MTDV